MLEYKQTNPKSGDIGRFGVTLPPTGTLATYISTGDFDQAIHLLIFYSFIGLRNHSLTLEETLGDYGLLHAVSHLVNNVDHWTYYQVTIDELVQKSHEMEQKLQQSLIYVNN